jgi:hypothetical protein
MLLVNVGHHTINVDQVVAFIQNDDHVKVMFNARTRGADGRDASLYTIELTGEEAERMRAWLKRNAEGVRGTAQTGFSIEE